MVFVDTLSKEKDREDTELLRKVCPSDEEESDEDTDEEDDEEDDDADEVSRSPRSAARRGRGAPDEGVVAGASPPCALITSHIKTHLSGD